MKKKVKIHPVKLKTFRDEYKVTAGEEAELATWARRSILRRLDIKKAVGEALSNPFLMGAGLDIRVEVAVTSSDLIDILKFRRRVK